MRGPERRAAQMPVVPMDGRSSPTAAVLLSLLRLKMEWPLQELMVSAECWTASAAMGLIEHRGLGELADGCCGSEVTSH